MVGRLQERLGAEEAHRAHNPRVGRSKLPVAREISFVKRPRQKKWAGLKKMTGTQHKNKTAAVFYINFLLSNATYIDLSLSMPI